MLGIRLVRRFISNSAGFTLLETMVAVSILTMGIGLVGTSVFQVLSGANFWQDDVAATKDLRHAISWLAGDALNTETTDLIDGDDPVSTVVLTTFAGNEVTYSLSGNVLTRTFDNGVDQSQITVATQVVSAGFSLAGDALTFTLEVTADRGGTKTNILSTNLR